MIIDSHGHYTTAPDALHAYRGNQIGQMNKPVKGSLNISDEELVASVSGQLKFQTDRGTDVTLFSPRAGSMGAPLWRRAHQPLLVGDLQRPRPPGVLAPTGELRWRVPTPPDAGRFAGKLYRRAGAVYQRSGHGGLQP